MAEAQQKTPEATRHLGEELEVDVQSQPAILTTTNYGLNSPGSAIPICCYRSRHVMLCGRTNSLGR